MSKTQAQKKMERQLHIEEKAEQRQAEVLARAEGFQAAHRVRAAQNEPQLLSRKERRQQQKIFEEKPDNAHVQSEAIKEVFTQKAVETSVIAATLEIATEQARKENETATLNPPSRVVQNHSTYCKGLKRTLLKLQKKLSGCTIIPGALSQVDTHSEVFELRFQRQADDHSYKFVARSGYTVQDVSISVSNSEVFTLPFILRCINQVLESTAEEADSSTSSKIEEGLHLATYNREMQHQRNSFWRTEHKEKHKIITAHEKELHYQKKINEQSRKLANKNIDRNLVKDHASRDVEIITGENRTKHSMKK